MSLPFGTRVYLEDKTLKKVEDLKFGDKVLSVKIKDDECTNHSELYSKYSKKDEFFSTKSIDKTLISLSSTHVYSVLINRRSSELKSLNNKIMSSITPLLISKTGTSPEMFYIKDFNNIAARKDATDNDQYYMQYLGAQFFSISENNKNVFIDNDNWLLQNKIEDINLTISPQPSVDIVLLDNHLLITENFICFGSAVGGIDFL